MNPLEWIFDDKRVAAFVLFLWMLFVVLILERSMDLTHSDFMNFGPSSHMHFMTAVIDTWERWFLLAGATFCTSCMTVFMGDALDPWLLNTVQDHKTKYLPYSKFTCYLISQTWTLYCNAMSIFGIALVMTQIDLLLVRMLADLIVNTFTTYKFMKHKVTDRRKYWLWTEDRLREAQSEVPMLVVEEITGA